MAQETAQAPIPPGATSGQVPQPPEESHGHGKSSFWTLALGSVGVVYGDIGTSPLYALRESLAHTKAHGIVETDILGIVSLLIWALFLVVTLKYVVFIMRADNKGEGGTLSLMALAQGVMGHNVAPIFFLGVAGAALFTGDAIITPAISVLSAVEGLKLVTPLFEPYVIPITILILITLFFVQSRGTEKVANFFGPIMIVWFVCLGIMGASHIGDAPRILLSFNPYYGIKFLFAHGFLGFVVMGSIFLAVTGAEALYADMGHFGRKPIQIAWIVFVLPALILNYLGQGALIINDRAALDNPFFMLAPAWALLPLVILATLATVIASQATITGAFSLARSAIQLGLLPRMEIRHTSHSQEGQIFIPRVNRILLIGVLLLVLMFKSSSNLASAYGIAVTASMVVDSCLAFVVIWQLWKWKPLFAGLLIGGFLIIEMAFFSANLVKILEGGYVPVLIGVAMMVLMWSWAKGSKLLTAKMHRDSIPMGDLIRIMQKSPPTRVAGTAIFLTSDLEVAPSALMHNLKHNKVLHERVLLMSVNTLDQPRVPESSRFDIEQVSETFYRVTLRYGYMESPRIPAALASLRKSGLKCDIMTTSFFLGRRTIKASPTSGMPAWQDNLFIALSRQSANATDFFSIPSDRVVELGAQVTI